MNTSAVLGLSMIMMGKMEAQEQEKQELTTELRKIRRRLDKIEGKCCVIVDEGASRPSKKQKTGKELEDDDNNSTIVEVEEITDAPAPKKQPK